MCKRPSMFRTYLLITYPKCTITLENKIIYDLRNKTIISLAYKLDNNRFIIKNLILISKTLFSLTVKIKEAMQIRINLPIFGGTNDSGAIAIL